MTELYNRRQDMKRRRYLRRNMPKAEALLWLRIQRRQVLATKFRRQFSVAAYVLDFYCPELKLAIELDGDPHFRCRARIRDEERRAFLDGLGIQVLRFMNTDVLENMDGVLEVLARAIETRRD